MPRSKGFSAEYVVEMTSEPVSGAVGAVAENGTVAEVDALYAAKSAGTKSAVIECEPWVNELTLTSAPLDPIASLPKEVVPLS